MRNLALLVAMVGCSHPMTGSPYDAPSSDATPPASLAFCPTSIDVFGYSNVLNQGCGGVGPSIAEFPNGLFMPGLGGYDRTLAGRLQARVAADAELVARFGSSWKIRSCSVGGGTMPTFVATEYDTGDPSGRTGRNVAMCTNDPAPVVLYSANDVSDTFHGGGLGTVPDDPDSYADHWADRFEEFRQARAPAALLVSPQHEWHGEQGGVLGGDPEDCTWQRPAWNRRGLERWQAAHPTVTDVVDVGDLQDVFKQHHACCGVLGVACLESWFDQGDGWVHFDCQGADALEDLWFIALRSYLLAHDFTCP